MVTKKYETLTSKNLDVLDRLTGVHMNIAKWTGLINVLKKTQPKNDKSKPNIYKKIQICPRNELKFYCRIYDAAIYRHLYRTGLNFMGCWVISTDFLERTHHIFCELREDFYKNVAVFGEKYDSMIKNCIKKEPDLAYLATNPKFSKENVLKKFVFEWHFFKISPVDSHLLRETFINEVEQLDRILYEDLAARAQELWQKIFSQRQTITARVGGSIKMIRSKLEILGFLSRMTKATLKLIDAALMEVPVRSSNRYLPPETHQILKTLVWTLKDPELSQMYSKKVDNGYSPLSILQEARIKIYGLENPISEENVWKKDTPPPLPH